MIQDNILGEITEKSEIREGDLQKSEKREGEIASGGIELQNRFTC